MYKACEAHPALKIDDASSVRRCLIRAVSGASSVRLWKRCLIRAAAQAVPHKSGAAAGWLAGWSGMNMDRCVCVCECVCVRACVCLFGSLIS
jgi:hypothetical protein